MDPRKDQSGSPPPPAKLSRGAKRVISAWLMLHLVAVAVPPLWVLSYPGPTSDNAVTLAKKGLSWYIDPMFLNHGYGFFGPDPGPSFLIRCELEMPDGRKVEQTYPDLKQQQPRLLYHRHFMLTSRLQEGPVDGLVVLYARSYARHLAERHGAKHVRVFLVRHDLATAEELLGGKKLNDPSSYAAMPDVSPAGTWTAPLDAVPAGAPPGLRPPEELAPPRPVPAGPAKNAFAPGLGVVTLEIALDPSRQAREPPLPPGGIATLSNLNGQGEEVVLNWQMPEEREREYVFTAGNPEMPSLVGHHIGFNELLLRVPLADRERLLIFRRPEVPIAEYPEGAP